MRENNRLLHKIANELGDETTGIKSNNFWLKRIWNKISTLTQGIATLGGKVDALMAIEFIKVETELPTPSKDTMNAFYLVPTDDSDDKFDYYVTVEEGSENNKTYDWDKVDNIHMDLSGYIEKSQTAGLVKNDGTIDTNTYLTTVSSSTITDVSTETVTVTYSDNSTATLTLLVQSI